MQTDWDWELGSEARSNPLDDGGQQAKKLLTGFIEFVFSENILQFAFGLM